MDDLKEPSFRQEIIALFEKYNVIFDIDCYKECVVFHSLIYPDGKAFIKETVNMVLDRESELMDFAASRIVD